MCFSIVSIIHTAKVGHRVVGTLPKVEEGVTMEASDLRRHENDSAKTTAVDDEVKLHQRKGLE